MAPSWRVSVLSFVLVAILGVASYVEGQVLFSKLPNALVVTATLPGGGPISGLVSCYLLFPTSISKIHKSLHEH